MSSLETKKILVAEDDSFLRELLEIALVEGGYQVTVVENGQQAIEKVQQNEFGLVLMDIQMPVLTGYDAARLLRASGHKLPIVAITAKKIGTEAEDYQKVFDCYLYKPFETDELYNLVGKYIGG